MDINRPLITIHNASTGEAESRPMNDAEYAQYEIDNAEFIAQRSAEESIVEKKKTILAALAAQTGFTAEEIKQALNA